MKKLFENVSGNQFKLVKESPEIRTDKLTPKEKNLISKAFTAAGVDGNGRFPKKEAGLAAITDALDSVGFQLDMVSGDIILGDQGNRLLTFRRKNRDGQDPFTEQPQISNSRISFNWENLSNTGQTPRFEILAYPS